MPAWMALLHSAVSDTSVPHYVRLYLTKAVLHVDNRHVARTATDPALQACFCFVPAHSTAKHRCL